MDIVKQSDPSKLSIEMKAGITKRAPLWMQKIGMEWLYRLLQEPRRMFKRYWVTNSRYL